MTKEHTDLNGHDVTQGPLADAALILSLLLRAGTRAGTMGRARNVSSPGSGRNCYCFSPFLLHLHDEPHDYYRFTRCGSTSPSERALKWPK
jgi:hypothetical protein